MGCWPAILDWQAGLVTLDSQRTAGIRRLRRNITGRDGRGSRSPEVHRGNEPDGRRRAHAIPIRRLHSPLRPSPPLPPTRCRHVLHRRLRPKPELGRRGGRPGASAPALDPRDRGGAPGPPLQLRQPPRPVPRLPRARVEPTRRDHLRRAHAVAPRRQAAARVPPGPRRRSRRARLGLRRRPRATEGCAGANTLAGLTGGSDDTYVRHMLMRARSKGWRVVVFNSRGCADSPVTTPQFYSASFTGDLRQVIDLVLGRYPQSNVYAVGWSLGANILVRYLGEETDKCPLSGAVSLCNPFNLVIADEDFHKGFNNIYDRALANALRTIFKKHALLFEDMEGEYDIPKAANTKTVRDFDEGLTRVSFGFKSVDDYYSNSSSSDSIKNVCIPLLCIQADNDPIAPSRGIPREDIKANPNCLLIVTPKGGQDG